MTMDTSGLFSPFKLNSITLENRFVMPGMQRGWCENGAPLPRLGEYYKRRVEGGVAMVISESLAVDHTSSTQTESFARLNESTLPAWTRVADEVRGAGGKILFQLWHEGALRHEGGEGPYSAYPTLSPSGLLYGDKQNGRAATGEELQDIKAGFIRSAELAKKAGANGVEIHSCHGYLLDQFLWATTNRREDGYGGDDIRQRVRLPAEIVAGVRAACGPDFVISFRYSQWKEADYEARIAKTPDELKIMLDVLSGAGVDVFHASTRRFWKPEWPESDLNFAGWSKALTGKPTITVGSVGLNIDVMETFFGGTTENRVEIGVRELSRRFNAGEFDLVSVGRGLIGDPDWVKKVRDGRHDDVRVFEREDLGKLEGDLSFVEEAHGKKTPAPG